MWSLQPGECLTAEKLAKIGKVFFPLRDVGVDLLVVKGDKHIGLQVKESRYYHLRKLKKKIKFKGAGKKNVYSFYFHFENEKVWDERVKNGPTDYSKFLGAWKLVEDVLSS